MGASPERMRQREATTKKWHSCACGTGCGAGSSQTCSCTTREAASSLLPSEQAPSGTNSPSDESPSGAMLAGALPQPLALRQCVEPPWPLRHARDGAPLSGRFFSGLAAPCKRRCLTGSLSLKARFRTVMSLARRIVSNCVLAPNRRSTPRSSVYLTSMACAEMAASTASAPNSTRAATSSPVERIPMIGIRPGAPSSPPHSYRTSNQLPSEAPAASARARARRPRAPKTCRTPAISIARVARAPTIKPR
mmetsp:Transcript_30155/g.97289  ORF Transcript_30155/g.97289 Transcript_30155/m.97289 type:complete len:250 (+) Transcript_30155:327-1076(+)